MSDRHLGYGVLAFLLLFLLIPIASLSLRLPKPARTRTVIFPSANTLNFLKIQDAVRINGFQAGSVKKTFWRDGAACVTIETGAPLDLHEGYRIVAEAKGFMGDRYLEIDPGDLQAPAIGPGMVLTGQFPIGPVEAIAKADILREKLQKIILTTDEFQKNGHVRKPLQRRFEEKSRSIDTLTISLLALLRRADRCIGKNTDSLSAFMRKAKAFASDFDGSMRASESTFETITARSRAITLSADSFLASINAGVLLLRAQDASGLTRTMDTLKSRIETVKRFTDELERDGVKIPVKL